MYSNLLIILFKTYIKYPLCIVMVQCLSVNYVLIIMRFMYYKFNLIMYTYVIVSHIINMCLYFLNLMKI